MSLCGAPLCQYDRKGGGGGGSCAPHLSDNRVLYGGDPSGNKRTTSQNASFQISTNQNEVNMPLNFLGLKNPYILLTWVACNITTTTTMTMKMRRLADVDYHARGREHTSGVSTSPEAHQSIYEV